MRNRVAADQKKSGTQPEGAQIEGAQIVNKAERFQSMDMTLTGRVHTASIPAAYTESPFPLEYYVEIRSTTKAWIFPGFDGSLTNQPYVVLRTLSS